MWNEDTNPLIKDCTYLWGGIFCGKKKILWKNLWPHFHLYQEKDECGTSTCKKVPYYPCWDDIKVGQVRLRTSIPTGGQWSPSPEVLVEIELLHLLGLNRVPYVLHNGVVSRKPCGNNVFDPVVIRPPPPVSVAITWGDLAIISHSPWGSLEAG